MYAFQGHVESYYWYMKLFYKWSCVFPTLGVQNLFFPWGTVFTGKYHGKNRVRPKPSNPARNMTACGIWHFQKRFLKKKKKKEKKKKKIQISS